MTENPSGLAEGGEIKVGSQAFSVLQFVNFVLGRVSLIWLCLHFDLYYKGDQFYKVVNSSNCLSPFIRAPS